MLAIVYPRLKYFVHNPSIFSLLPQKNKENKKIFIFEKLESNNLAFMFLTQNLIQFNFNSVIKIVGD